MEVKIERSEILRGMRLAQGIADRKGTMPMLANVLLRMHEGKLMCAATDLNVSVVSMLPVVTGTVGGITVSAKAFHDIIANLPDGVVSVRRVDNNWAEIKAGKISYKLVGVPDRDFPKVPDHREAPFGDIDAATFREMIDRTLFSVCNDETRFHLNGVLFESTGTTARMVSTDGHRLSKVDRALAGAPKLSAGVIIPKKGLLEIKRLLDGVNACKVGFHRSHIFIATDGITLAVKLIDATFPPYEQVIPKDHKRSVVIGRGMLLDALKRSSLMASDARGVKLTLSQDRLQVESDNPDVGAASEDLEVGYSGDPIVIGLNPKYLADILNQIASDEVVLEMGDVLDPVVVKPSQGEDYLGVIMPMRA